MKINKETAFFVMIMTAAVVMAGCAPADMPEEAPTDAAPTVATREPTREDTPEPGVPCDLPLPAGGNWEVALCETFADNSYGWQAETQDNPYSAYTSAVTGGQFVVDYRAKSFAGFTQSALTWFDVAEERNFVISVTGEIDSAFENTNWGIAFHADDDSFFLFSLRNDDTYIFEVFEENRWLPLITRKQTSVIRVGEPNTVRIEASGGDFFFSINGEMVNQFSGGQLTGDKIQLMVSAREGASAVFRFDDVVVQR